MDWPLSREEKKYHIMQLYDRELQAMAVPSSSSEPAMRKPRDSRDECMLLVSPMPALQTVSELMQLIHHQGLAQITCMPSTKNSMFVLTSGAYLVMVDLQCVTRAVCKHKVLRRYCGRQLPMQQKCCEASSTDPLSRLPLSHVTESWSPAPQCGDVCPKRHLRVLCGGLHLVAEKVSDMCHAEVDLLPNQDVELHGHIMSTPTVTRETRRIWPRLPVRGAGAYLCLATRTRRLHRLEVSPCLQPWRASIASWARIFHNVRSEG